LVINAGLSEFSRIEDVTEGFFDRQIGLNVRALLFAVQSVLPLMGPGSTIVLVGSIAAELGTEGYGVYGASKAAVRSLARTWTTELAPRGIRVNVVSPGPTDTAMVASVSDDVRATLADKIPLGRLGRPGEIAAAALFLASDESSFIAGADLPVDVGSPRSDESGTDERAAVARRRRVRLDLRLSEVHFGWIRTADRLRDEALRRQRSAKLLQ